MSRRPAEVDLDAAFAHLSGPSSPADVVLVSMPFGPLNMPSIGLGILAASVRRVGASVRQLHFPLAFSQLTGDDFYTEVASQDRTASLVGEWIFGEAAWPGAGDGDGYVEEVLRRRSPDHAGDREVDEDHVAAARRARALAPGFVERCAAVVLEHRPVIVGITSVFQQHVASLALACAVKARAPETVIVLGGANCEGAMGRATLEQWPWADVVVSGEGDEVFPALVEDVLGGRRPRARTGVFRRGQVPLTEGGPQRATVADLDSVPAPDYDDYFEQLAASGASLGAYRDGEVELPFETSRGCWWGERKHCTFCGLNGESMAYRSKAPEVARRQLLDLVDRHPGCRVSAVDNILAREYFDTFLPWLAEEGRELGLFYETKANLGRTEVGQLAAARVREIQPGIESLHSDVLRLMRKGVRAIQNVQLLKWCEAFGVVPRWNLLWGFAGERGEQYEAMAELIPAISHLRPPGSAGPVAVHRFSPFFTDPEAFGFTDLRPYPAYRHVYPAVPAARLADLAYYFAHDRAPGLDPPSSYTGSVVEAVRSWRRGFRTNALLAEDDADRLRICDLRPGDHPMCVVVDGLAAAVLRASAEIATVAQLADRLATSEDEVLAALAELGRSRLVLREGNACLALPLLLDDYRLQPSPRSVEDVVRVEKVRMARAALQAAALSVSA